MRFRALPEEVAAEIVAEFEARWEGYNSPSQAAQAIGVEFGVTMATVRNAVLKAGVWPVMPARDYAKLVEENTLLRAQLVELGHTPRELAGDRGE